MFRIGKVLIGPNKPCVIVAELSGNHGGNFKRIKKLITQAKKSGADLIKLQTYNPDTITLNCISFTILPISRGAALLIPLTKRKPF